MLIAAALAIGIVYVWAIWLPRILVALMATLVDILLARKARRLTRSMLARAPSDLDYDRKPGWAERRAMRESLQVALSQTELRSLLPALMARVYWAR